MGHGDAEREAMSAAERRYADRSVPRNADVRWTFRLDGEEHEVRVVRGGWSPIGPKVEVDGEPAGRIMAPRLRRTMTERCFEIGDHSVVVTLEARREGPNPIADVFVDQFSASDGRTLDEVRSAAPRAEMLAGRLIGPFLNPGSDSESGSGPGWNWDFAGESAGGCLIGILALVVLGVVGTLIVLLIDILAVLVGSVVLFVAANTIPGRRSVLDAIRWRGLAIEGIAVVAAVSAAAWWVRHH
jgi:hypothetical protein